MTRFFNYRGAVVFGFLIAFVLRLHVVLHSVYIWDEDRDWIPIARSISMNAGNWHLPVREFQHALLPAYFMRLGSLLLGETPLGFRIGGVIAGLVTVLAIYFLALLWSGRAAALAALFFAACNEYLIGISAIAFEKAYFLCFSVLAILAFARFLRTSRPGFLYAAAVAAGCAALCKELTVFVLAAFGLAMLLPANIGWFRRKEPYLALLLFLAVISPDLIWNFGSHAENPQAMGYTDHLARTAYSPNIQVLLFYGRQALRWLAPSLGFVVFDVAAEVPSMNFLAGALLLGGVLLETLRKPQDPVGWLLRFLFWPIVIFFTLVESRSTSEFLDPTVWSWFDLSVLPAILLACHRLFSTEGLLRRLAEPGAAAALAYGSYSAIAAHLWLPVTAVAFTPESIYQPFGRDIAVKAVFLHCMACEQNPRIALDEVRVSKPDGDSELKKGNDPREFVLRAGADAGGILPIYEISYIVEMGGRGIRVSSDVGIRSTPPPWREPFWTHP